MVVTRRRGLAAAEGLDNGKEKGGREVGGGAPSGKRDAVGARAGVIGVFDGGEDVSKSRGREEGRVNSLGVGGEKGVLLRGRRGGDARSPNIRPEGTSDSSFTSIVGGGRVRW